MKIISSLLALWAAGSMLVYGAEDCAGHDHDAPPAESADHDAADHADHGDDEDAPESAVVLAPGIAGQVGLTMREAAGGVVERRVSFPAEVELNRDRMTAVTPLVASIVKSLHAAMGAEVKAGDRLAVLENRETLAAYEVTSPRDGTVISMPVSAGESAGEDTVLFEIADLSSVWVDVRVFPQYQPAVRIGQPVTLEASGGHVAETTIAYVSPLLSKETRTLRARCVLENPDGDFRPGAFVRAHLAVESRRVDVAVEPGAVQRLDGETVVFVAAGEGYAPRVVETGLAGRDLLEIRRGLSPGERYVAQGAFDLKAEIVTSGIDPHAGHGH